MKKKNLAILLIMPFLVALFGIATIKTAFNMIDNDIIRIIWEYKDNELFRVGDNILLKAEGVVADKRYPASDGNRLVWEVENADGAAERHAETVTDGQDNWFLRTYTPGRVTITCTTEKHNVTPMSMTGILFKDNAFVINPKINGSGQNVDRVTYYGEYDLSNGEKKPAVIEFELTASVETVLGKVVVESATPNLDVDLEAKKITINGAAEEMSSVVLKNPDMDLSSTFSFQVVKDGINVYDYNDLLYCTNRSQDGEIAVLRKNFESKENFDASTASNVALFGNFNGSDFGFGDEVYRFETTYNREYIDQWNAFASDEGYQPVSDVILAGLRVQKDFYGNGYTLNLHNLCFPSTYITVDGKNIYTPGEKDLFKGPKPFYLLGDPGNLPLVTAYGQDNIGVYIDGDGITFNDVKVKNCDFGLIVGNLDYAGTVVEVNGSDNTICNSVLGNGKNIVRSFSSENLTIDNCILNTSRNFLLSVGSNEYEKNEKEAETLHTFITIDGQKVTCTLDEYLDGAGERLLTYLVAGFADADSLTAYIKDGTELPKYPAEQVKAALHSLTEAMGRGDAVDGTQFKGSTKINDTVFYRSGIAAIGVDTMFNGPFLYDNKPSMVEALMKAFGNMFEVALPLLPDNIAGSSYPVKIDISGDTRFYDYKSLNEWDISGLINQNIGTIVNSMDTGRSFDITLDDIFPLKQILTNIAYDNRYIYSTGGKNYINIPVAVYGGGVNLSQITETELSSSGLTELIGVDLLDSYLNMNTQPNWRLLAPLLGDDGEGGDLKLSDLLAAENKFVPYVKEVLTKTVTTVMGFEPFKFQFISSPEGLFDTENGVPLVPDYKVLQKNKERK